MEQPPSTFMATTYNPVSKLLIHGLEMVRVLGGVDVALLTQILKRFPTQQSASARTKARFYHT